MKIFRLCCVAAAVLTAFCASAREYSPIKVYSSDNARREYLARGGFRLDANAGASFLLVNFGGSRIQADMVGSQICVAPTYVLKSEMDAIGLSVIKRAHSFKMDRIAGKVDLDITYVGMIYTRLLRPYQNGSFFFDAALYFGQLKEKGTQTELRNKFDTGGVAVSAGYSLKMVKRVRMMVKLSVMYSSYTAQGGIYDRSRNLSTVNLSTGFWLFK